MLHRDRPPRPSLTFQRLCFKPSTFHLQHLCPLLRRAALCSPPRSTPFSHLVSSSCFLLKTQIFLFLRGEMLRSQRSRDLVYFSFRKLLASVNNLGVCRDEKKPQKLDFLQPRTRHWVRRGRNTKCNYSNKPQPLTLKGEDEASFPPYY